MITNAPKPSSESEDALIDEVRAIRREICAQAGNDVDRLFGMLRETESDYAARRGMYSGISKEAAQHVVAGWGAEALHTDDPLVDEVRRIRQGLAERDAQQ